jgi:hypothetical protein
MVKGSQTPNTERRADFGKHWKQLQHLSANAAGDAISRGRQVLIETFQRFRIADMMLVWHE